MESLPPRRCFRLVAVKDPKNSCRCCRGTSRRACPVGQSPAFPTLRSGFPGVANLCPRDQKVGYVTRGKGVAVHRVDCSNLPKDVERFIKAEWDAEERGVYPLTLED